MRITNIHLTYVPWVACFLLLTGWGYHLHRNQRGPGCFRFHNRSINAAELYRYFLADRQSASLRYLDRLVDVDGIVTAVSLSDTCAIIQLKGDTSIPGKVHCTLMSRNIPYIPRTGYKVRMRGYCAGFGETVCVTNAVLIP